jgi:hypothetical protein
MTGNVIRITPFMHVGDVAQAVAFFTGTLGFDCPLGPVDQQYGQRELMIRAPDGNLVVFGQAIT